MSNKAATSLTTFKNQPPRDNGDSRRFLQRFLQRYTTAVSTSVHRDRLLKTLQYSLWWYAHLALPYAKAANNLGAELSWARYLTRLAEGPMALQGLLYGTWTPFGDVKDPTSNFSKLGRQLGRILAATMVLYYPTEHVAFGHWKLMHSSTKGRIAEWYSAISCKAWLAYILTDLVQGYISLAQTPLVKEKTDRDDDNDTQQQEQQRQQHKQRVIMARNLLFLLPAYHWSRTDWDKKPFLPATVVNGCMVVEAFLSLYQTSLEVPAPPLVDETK